jgi:2-hydroxy-3-keto-5-methylthiopentenyl-1-phosphate phosphatase
MLTASADDDLIVYIGEGYSDRCPARFADIIFAKDELLRFCQRENISYFAYATFADIQDRMKDIVNATSRKRGHRKRRQAEIARRNVLLGG